MQWAFDGGRTNNPHALSNHRENQVVYASTHDTDTTVGWYRALPRRRQRAMPLDPHEPSWSMLELAYGSRASLAMAPAQDVLGLGSEGRMNTPGTVGGNWRWRLRRGQLTEARGAAARPD